MAVAAAAATVCVGVLTSGGSAFASDGAGHHPVFNGGLPLPAHVFAPYFETYNPDSLPSLSAVSGAKFLTLAFLQTDQPGSCAVYWNGDPAPRSPRSRRTAATSRDPSRPVVTSSRHLAGTQRTPSAPRSPTAAPTSTRSPQVYENVITTYDVHAARLGRRVELARPTGRHRPAQQGHQEGRGLGRGERHAPCNLATRSPTRPTGLARAGWPSCRTRSHNARESTSSTS